MLEIHSKVILPVVILIGIALAQKPYAPTLKHDDGESKPYAPTLRHDGGGNMYHPICDSDDEGAETCSGDLGGPLISDFARPGKKILTCPAIAPNLDWTYTMEELGKSQEFENLVYEPWEPIPRLQMWWFLRHFDNLRTTETLGKEIKIVFIGSSVVEFWGTTGKEIWDTKYAPLGAVNYGIYGDGTEHVLWRIENGELDGLSPKLVVVYVGSNNVPFFTADECTHGVNAVIDKLHEKLPDTNILYVSSFPRADQRPVINMLRKIRYFTETLKPMIDNDTSRNSYFLDLFWSYASESMESIHEEFYVADKLHLNFLGYALWDDLMNSTFYSLLE